MKTSKNQVVMPINVATMIDEKDPVFKMAEILEKLDYRKLHSSYRRRWRKIDPEVMFSIVVYANMRGIFSSRAIEEACKTDIRFMWLLQYEPAPDHTTIARFLEKNMNGCAEGLFYQLVQKLSEIGEIEFESMFVDGTKIEANANKYSFVWAKAVEKNLVKLDKKAEQAVISMSEKYGFSECIDLERAVDWLHSIARFRQEEFVYGKGRRKTELQKDCEKLEGYLRKRSEYAEKLRICGNRKSYSKTDLEATFMRMKDDHMGNGQLKPGYNLQIGVESEYIVGLGLFSNPTDTTTLIPFLERTAEGTGRRHGNIVADAGYASEENYTYLESMEQNAYIKPADHELKKTRKFKKNIYHKDNMPYNAESDSFTCPNDKRLLHAYDRNRKTDNGCMILKSYYVCEDCSGCSRRENCFKGQYENRKIELSKTMRRQKDEAEKTHFNR